jgi:hypothetical protein
MIGVALLQHFLVQHIRLSQLEGLTLLATRPSLPSTLHSQENEPRVEGRICSCLTATMPLALVSTRMPQCPHASPMCRRANSLQNASMFAQASACLRWSLWDRTMVSNRLLSMHMRTRHTLMRARSTCVCVCAPCFPACKLALTVWRASRSSQRLARWGPLGWEKKGEREDL